MSESGAPLTILLVDDETRLRQALARSLAARGHRVDEAGCYADAISAIERTEYDLLLLDVNLPDATGWDVLRRLRAAGNELPAIVISAIPPSAQRVREFRPLGVLHKPFPIESLLRLVQKADRRPPPGPQTAPS
jgi:DNA-binding response OmpR family regulator